MLICLNTDMYSVVKPMPSIFKVKLLSRCLQMYVCVDVPGKRLVVIVLEITFKRY